MGIRFFCPNGHKLHVKSFLAGKRGICPYCGVVVQIPLESTRPSSKELRRQRRAAKEGQFPAEVVSHPPERQRMPAIPATPEESATAESTPSPDQPAWISRLGEAKAPATLLGGGKPQPEIQRPAVSSRPAGSVVDRPASPPAPPSPGKSLFEPLDQDPAAVWYVMPPQGGRYGPASAAVMRTWLMEGRIGLDTLVWRSGWPEWRQAEEVFPNLEKFLQGLAQRLTSSEVTPTPGYPATQVPTHWERKGYGEENGRGYLIPIVVAALIGGIGIAALLLLIFARTAG
ncbi:MAG: GYF domain-containing protein [Thermoguttaceae bacterium]|nr:GYF domain-containing protein [Thermoguttaceae bacterium]MDW8079763.1 GYF domain-containing protein [Thermoguttaceae bacterium]